MNDAQETTSIGQSECDWLRQKLQTICTSSKYCGLCLESDGNLCSVYTELVIGKQDFSKSLYDIIIYVFNDDIENFMCSQLLCDSCLEKIIQSYIFVHNTKQMSRVIQNCVGDIQSKVFDVNAQLDHEINYNNANVMIVLENDPELFKYIVDTRSLQVVPTATPKVMRKEVKLPTPIEQEPTKKLIPKTLEISKGTLHKNNKMIETDSTPNISLKAGKIVIQPLSTMKTATPHYNTYKCSDCSEIFTNYRLLKEHEKLKHKTTVFRCELCDKCYNTQQYLNIHYKTHERERCKICQLILPEEDIMDHLRNNHANLVYCCKVCKLVYYSQDSLDTHFKITHLINDTKGNAQCVMCLRNFTENEVKTHRCKFSCSECFVMPCIHYKYLKSFREQVLNHVNKIECVDCDYQTRRKEHLIGHVNREHLDHHPFTCAKCEQQFYTKLSLKTHIVQFHQDLSCEYCDYQFKDNNTLESHRKACKFVTRPYGCNWCDASFDLEEELQRHDNLRHSGGGHACNLCKSKFLTQMELDQHRAKEHGGIQCKKRRKHIECSLCNEFFKNLKELMEHEKLHNPEDVYPCKLCPKHFNSLKKLYIHNQKHYTLRITCPGCDKKVAASFYTQHSAKCTYIKESANSHVCDKCGKFFNTESMLHIHQRSHMDREPCPRCGKILRPHSLRKHMEQVHGEFGDNIPKSDTTSKPSLGCQLCGHAVKKKTDLEAHMNRYHLKIKPYVCSVCKKAFCGKFRLKEHLATHTSDNTCFCSLCGKKFANRVCLKMHFRMHTGEAPYACDICGQKFRSSSIMKTHRLKKHLEKTVSCPLCDNMFYMVRDMRHHFKKVHWKYKDRPFNPREVEELDKSYYYLFEDGRLPKVKDNE